MGTIADLYRRCAPVNLEQVAEESIRENASVVVSYNQKQLYETSIRADGENLLLYNSIIYALDKNRRNPEPGIMHPDLFDTGDFYRAMFLTVEGGEFEIDSRDWKSSHLKDKYGDTIFGLTSEHKAEFAQDALFKSIKKTIESLTGLKFT